MGWDPDRNDGGIVELCSNIGYYAALAQTIFALMALIGFIYLWATSGRSQHGPNISNRYGATVVTLLLLLSLPGFLAYNLNGFAAFWGFTFAAILITAPCCLLKTFSGFSLMH